MRVTHRGDELHGVGRHEEAGGEGREMSGAADGPAGVGLGQGRHAICAPQLGALAEILTQRGEHAHLQANQTRVVGPAACGHVDVVHLCGVMGPG